MRGPTQSRKYKQSGGIMFSNFSSNDLILLKKALQTKIRLDEEIMSKVDKDTTDSIQLKMQSMYNQEIQKSKSLLSNILDELVKRQVQ